MLHHSFHHFSLDKLQLVGGLGLSGLGGLEQLRLFDRTVLGGSTRFRGSHVLSIQLSAKTYG